MKSAKLKLFCLLLACVFLLIIATFAIKPKEETHAADYDAASAVLVGQDSEAVYNLNIELKVFYDADADLYRVTATAKWKKPGIFTRSKKCAENLYFDYIVLTWGGKLLAQSKQIYGEYKNGREIEFSRQISDSYGQFVWQFNEKFKRQRMNFAQATLYLKKTEADIGRETDVRLAYIHTYEINKAVIRPIDKEAIRLSFGRGLPANKISFLKFEESWRKEITVAGINY